MEWNWQRTDWPSFRWESDRLEQAEAEFLLGAGATAGILQVLDPEAPAAITAEAMTAEAVKTSEIEGEILRRDSVSSSIRRRLGLTAPSGRRPSPAEDGIAELMVDLHQNVQAPLDSAALFRWHEMVVRGRRDLHDIGCYRTHEEPMQVVSGGLDSPTVHFEAPPSTEVPRHMSGYLDWFSESAPTGLSDPPVPATTPSAKPNFKTLPALTRAGTAHLYFVSIHPFEDGNGRIARAISEKALGQALGRPALTSLATVILKHRSEYYKALERANKSNEITAWLAWFAGIVLEAQQHTLRLVQFTIKKTRLLDRLRGQINPRQEKAILRVLQEGLSGFEGRLSAGNYRSITGAGSATATRDLADLVKKGALKRTGERRHARYHLPFPIEEAPRVTVQQSGSVVGLPVRGAF